jgi:hypothetical protein
MAHFQSKRMFGLMFFFLLPVVLASLSASPAFSQAPFFQGKTITLIVGAGPVSIYLAGPGRLISQNQKAIRSER